MVKVFKADVVGHVGAKNTRHAIYSVDFQPNGNRLATAGGDCRVRLWNTLTLLVENSIEKIQQAPLAVLTSHGGSVNIVRWSPDGKYLASGSDDNYIFVYKYSPTSSSTIGNNANNINSTIKSNSSSGKEKENRENWPRCFTLQGHTMDVLDLSWSTSSLLASASIDNRVLVWDFSQYIQQNISLSNLVNNKSSLSTSILSPVKILNGHESFVRGVSFDPLGEYLATLGADGLLILWDTRNWRESFRVQDSTLTSSERTLFTRLSWAPDGASLCVTASLKSLKPTSTVLKRGTWVSVANLVGHQSETMSCRFLPVILNHPVPIENENKNNNQDKSNGNISPIKKNGTSEKENSENSETSKSRTRKSSGSIVGVSDLPLKNSIESNNPSSVKSMKTEASCIVASGDLHGVISLWSSSRTRPLVVLKDLFSGSVADLAWTVVENNQDKTLQPQFSVILCACSMDGSVALVDLQDSLGSPFDALELESHLTRLYGEAVNNTGIGNIGSTRPGARASNISNLKSLDLINLSLPQFLELPETLAKSEVLSEKAFEYENMPSALPPEPQVSIPSELQTAQQLSPEQILSLQRKASTKTSSGKKRVAPVTLSLPSTTAHAPPPLSLSSSSTSSSSSSTSKSVVSNMRSSNLNSKDIESANISDALVINDASNHLNCAKIIEQEQSKRVRFDESTKASFSVSSPKISNRDYRVNDNDDGNDNFDFNFNNDSIIMNEDDIEQLKEEEENEKGLIRKSISNKNISEKNESVETKNTLVKPSAALRNFLSSAPTEQSSSSINKDNASLSVSSTIGKRLSTVQTDFSSNKISTSSNSASNNYGSNSHNSNNNSNILKNTGSNISPSKLEITFRVDEFICASPLLLSSSPDLSISCFVKYFSSKSLIGSSDISRIRSKYRVKARLIPRPSVLENLSQSSHSAHSYSQGGSLACSLSLSLVNDDKSEQYVDLWNSAVWGEITCLTAFYGSQNSSVSNTLSTSSNLEFSFGSLGKETNEDKMNVEKEDGGFDRPNGIIFVGCSDGSLHLYSLKCGARVCAPLIVSGLPIVTLDVFKIENEENQSQTFAFSKLPFLHKTSNLPQNSPESEEDIRVLACTSDGEIRVWRVVNFNNSKSLQLLKLTTTNIRAPIQSMRNRAAQLFSNVSKQESQRDSLVVTLDKCCFGKNGVPVITLTARNTPDSSNSNNSSDSSSNFSQLTGTNQCFSYDSCADVWVRIADMRYALSRLFANSLSDSQAIAQGNAQANARDFDLTCAQSEVARLAGFGAREVLSVAHMHAAASREREMAQRIAETYGASDSSSGAASSESFERIERVTHWTNLITLSHAEDRLCVCLASGMAEINEIKRWFAEWIFLCCKASLFDRLKWVLDSLLSHSRDSDCFPPTEGNSSCDELIREVVIPVMKKSGCASQICDQVCELMEIRSR